MQKKNIIFLAPLIFLSATLFPSGLPGIANKATKKKEKEETVPLLAPVLDADADPQRPANAAIQLAPSLMQAQRHNPAKSHNNTLSTQLKDAFEARAQEQFSADTKKRIDVSLIASTILGFVHGYVFHKRIETDDYHEITSLQFAPQNNDVVLLKQKRRLVNPNKSPWYEYKSQRYSLEGTFYANPSRYNDFTHLYSTKKALMTLWHNNQDEQSTLEVTKLDGSTRSILLHGKIESFTTTPDGEYCIYSVRTPADRKKIIVTFLPLESSQEIDAQKSYKLVASKTNDKQEFLLGVTDNFANAKIYEMRKDAYNFIDTFGHPLGPFHSGACLPSSIAISQEKKLVFMGLGNGAIVRRCLTTKKSLLSNPLWEGAPYTGPSQVQFFNNESMIAAVCRSIMRIFNVDSFVSLQEINTSNWIRHFDISADDSMIAVAFGKHCFSVYCLGQEPDPEKERDARAHQENDGRVPEVDLVVHQPPARPAQNFFHNPNDVQKERYEQAISRCNCVIS